MSRSHVYNCIVMKIVYLNLFIGNANGACVMFQNIIKRPLLWIPCRHHIGEVVLTHVWNALEIEASKAPEIQLFKRMKTHYHHYC